MNTQQKSGAGGGRGVPTDSPNAGNVMVTFEAPQNLLAIIARAAADPAVDVEKMDRLLQMQDRIRSRDAEAEFNLAMNQAQSQIGRIAQDRENKQTHSRYATYAALDRVLRPIYVEAGFSLSFDTGEAPADAVCVLCYVSHRGGHTRTYRALIPVVTVGPQGNAVMTPTHATGSAMAYGKRYLLKMIFNLAEGVDPEDDDGNGAGGTMTAEEQAAAERAAAILAEWVDAVKAADLLETLKARRVEFIEAYGNANNVPAALKAAYNARLHELSPQVSK